VGLLVYVVGLGVRDDGVGVRGVVYLVVADHSVHLLIEVNSGKALEVDIYCVSSHLAIHPYIH
jgi:hypothetical protein